MNEPNTLDEQIDEILNAVWNEACEMMEDGGTADLSCKEGKAKLKTLFTEHSKEARIDEIKSWFDLPKHYPGEEYRDEPFAKVKCKTPDRVQYYTLDSRFTYALLTRLTQLSKRNKGEDNEMDRL